MAAAPLLQVEDEEYQLRPMNCPFHISVYKDGYYSYRDMPLRLAELGTVYRCVRAAGAWLAHSDGWYACFGCIWYACFGSIEGSWLERVGRRTYPLLPGLLP